MARATRKTRLAPNRSPSQPDAGMNTARLTRNPMEMPSTRSSGTESSREMVGSVTFTIVVSMIVMNMATTKTTLTVTLGLIWRAVIWLIGHALHLGAAAWRLLFIYAWSIAPGLVSRRHM